MLTDEMIKDLNARAIKMRSMSYCPYSNYSVGAALLTSDGKIFEGCNIENASYGACNCGERTAVFKAVSEGAKKIVAISITGFPKGVMPTGEKETDYGYPCGICRQVLREFSNPKELVVIICCTVDKYKKTTLEEILPMSFGPEHLNK